MNWRFLPIDDPKSKRSFVMIPEGGNYFEIPGVYQKLQKSKKSRKSRKGGNYFGMPGVYSPVAPVLPYVLSPGAPGLPGVFVTTSTTGTPTATGAAAATGAAGTAAAGAAGAAGAAAPATTTTTSTASPAATSALLAATGNFSVITPPITNIRHLTNPDSDPELQRKVIKHFYNELKEKYFYEKFQNFFKYIVVENNKPRLVKSEEELQKNADNNNNSKLKIKFITDNIFTKYDLEVLISKLIAKYSMLNSEDEYNLHWYNIKYKHSSLIKKAMYKKIKYRLEKKLNF
jgi:hypothetical protein